MATTPEGRVKAAVKKLLTERDIWYYMPVAGAYARQGFPDFYCLADGNRSFFIETKAPGKLNAVTENQKNVHAEMRARGATVLVVDNVEPVKEFLNGFSPSKCS